jgi:hypothetical protein
VAGKNPDSRTLDLGITQEKIRYGRATLAVGCWASVSGTPAAEALKAFHEGELSDEDVAWAFVRSQVVEHSSSFDFADADLAVLLPRVTKAIHTPDMKAQTPAELIPELDELVEMEGKLWEKTTALSRQWAESFTFKGMDKLVGRIKEVQPNFAASFPNITFNYDDWLKTHAAFGSNVTFDPALVQRMTGLTSEVDFSELFGNQFVKLQDALDNYEWFTAASEVAAAARMQGFTTVADAADATAKTAETAAPGDPASIDALLEGLQPMLGSIEQAVRESAEADEGKDGNSVLQQLFIALAVGVILLAMQAALARMGIHVDPPTAAPPVEKEISKGGGKPQKEKARVKKRPATARK